MLAVASLPSSPLTPSRVVGANGAVPSETRSLLERVAAGDPAAARACIERYAGLVWSLARRASPRTDEAEDAVQEIFLDVWKSAARFDPGRGSEATFVAMIARRRLIDRRRRGRSREHAPLAEDLVEEGAFGRVEAAAEVAIAARSLSDLRPEPRRVLLLATCEGLSHAEIADALGMPLGTVKAHVRRGLLHVKRALFGGGGDDDDHR
jgi:RNA polymerase sigma-70 factor (ECF subfamily)